MSPTADENAVRMYCGHVGGGLLFPLAAGRHYRNPPFGGVSYNVIVHETGSGEFQGSPTLPEKGKRAFTLKPGQFQKLATAIQPYMRDARPATDASVRDVIEGKWPRCPTKKGYALDAPALYLRWQGPKTNVHYLVDFGCDYDANRARNQRLLDAVHQLPIRQYLGAFG